jgi:hypothetical protein
LLKRSHVSSPLTPIVLYGRVVNTCEECDISHHMKFKMTLLFSTLFAELRHCIESDSPPLTPRRACCPLSLPCERTRTIRDCVLIVWDCRSKVRSAEETVDERAAVYGRTRAKLERSIASTILSVLDRYGYSDSLRDATSTGLFRRFECLRSRLGKLRESCWSSSRKRQTHRTGVLP